MPSAVFMLIFFPVSSRAINIVRTRPENTVFI